MSRQLDVRGEICPYPMIKASEALKKLLPDETLEVLTDHAPALTTIPWEAAKQGYQTTIERVGSPEWKITLTPAPDASAASLLVSLPEQLQAAGALDE